MVATLTSKGQITLPIGLRRQLGLKDGDRIYFVTAADGSVTVQPVKNGLLALAGMAKPSDGRRRTLREMDAAIAVGRAKASGKVRI
jgi:AbrB family looped-hinge helix DNA binding protein